MTMRFVGLVLSFVWMFSSIGQAQQAPTQTPTPPKRIALVIGQGAYPNSNDATQGLQQLPNTRRDAEKVAALLSKHGITVVTCDGSSMPEKPGCFDLKQADLAKALDDFEKRSTDADLAFVFFAGHGMDTHQGNVLTPIDAKVDCSNGNVANAVLVDRVLKAVEPARNKLVVLDSCRDNPIGAICPHLKNKQFPFRQIEAGSRRNFMLVTAAQFGEVTLDGPQTPDGHSPFTAAFLDNFASNPAIFFDQLFNAVAATTHTESFKLGIGNPNVKPGFAQVPGRVIGGAAPADCLAGKDCIGDPRMAAMAQDVQKLTRGIEQKRLEIRRDAAALVEDARKLRRSGQLGTAGTRIVLDMARRQFDRLQADLPKDLDLTRQRILLMNEFADINLGLGDTTAADAAANEALRIAHEAIFWTPVHEAGGPQCPTLQASHAPLRMALVSAYEWRRDTREHQGKIAQSLLDNACQFALLDALPNSRMPRIGVLRARALAYRGRGDAHLQQGRAADAAADFRRSLALQRHVSRLLRHSPVQRELVAKRRIEYGDALRNLGRISDALVQYEAARSVLEKLTAADDADIFWRWDHARTLERLGYVKTARGEIAEAGRLNAEYARLMTSITAADKTSMRALHNTSIAYANMAQAAAAAGRPVDAAKHHREALRLAGQLARHDPHNWRWQENLAWRQRNYASFLKDRDRVHRAVLHMEIARRSLLRLTQRDASALDRQRELAGMTTDLGDILAARPHESRAQLVRRQVVEADRIMRGLPDDAGRSIWWPWLRAHLTQRLGETMVEPVPDDASDEQREALHRQRLDRLRQNYASVARQREMIWQRDTTHGDAGYQLVTARRQLAKRSVDLTLESRGNEKRLFNQVELAQLGLAGANHLDNLNVLEKILGVSAVADKPGAIGSAERPYFWKSEYAEGLSRLADLEASLGGTAALARAESYRTRHLAVLRAIAPDANLPHLRRELATALVDSVPRDIGKRPAPEIEAGLAALQEAGRIFRNLIERGDPSVYFPLNGDLDNDVAQLSVVVDRFTTAIGGRIRTGLEPRTRLTPDGIRQLSAAMSAMLEQARFLGRRFPNEDWAVTSLDDSLIVATQVALVTGDLASARRHLADRSGLLRPASTRAPSDDDLRLRLVRLMQTEACQLTRTERLARLMQARRALDRAPSDPENARVFQQARDGLDNLISTERRGSTSPCNFETLSREDQARLNPTRPVSQGSGHRRQ